MTLPDDALPDDTPHGLQDLVLALLADRLDLPAGDLDPARSFLDLGLDSVEAVFLCGALEERLGIPVDPVLVFEARSVAAFAATLGQPRRPPC